MGGARLFSTYLEGRWGGLISHNSHREHWWEKEPSSPQPGVLRSLPILPISMSYFTGGFRQRCSCSRLPSSCARNPCRAKERVAPQASVVGCRVSPGFLPCSWQSYLVTGHLWSLLGIRVAPCLVKDVLPRQISLCLGHFTFCLGSWVSWHHLVRSFTSVRATRSCIVPQKCLCHLFLTTSLPPAVPQHPRLMASDVWLLVGSELSSKCPAYRFLAAT